MTRKTQVSLAFSQIDSQREDLTRKPQTAKGPFLCKHEGLQVIKEAVYMHTKTPNKICSELLKRYV